MPFTLPDLPYAYDALEPTIDAQTMEIHHGKHHQAYVDNANKALEGTEWANRASSRVLASLDAIPDDIQTRRAQQRRRPREPLPLLGDHEPGRRRRAGGRARGRDRRPLRERGRPKRERSTTPA